MQSVQFGCVCFKQALRKHIRTPEFRYKDICILFCNKLVLKH